eukprot:CAMPEP_0172199478 /NCGR_PEP_ID=MMETSP1050-20130122/28718_1 /TAXON_ID=233186 /ORGANISM="Cryptomonas curvata, Strain CCAP979/52" /LENGTH=44 /DNA_ID= /DNA_START= /DNA_END= /DNA_ORIENTATION=
MTSDDTHQATRDLLQRNGHFGADPSQISLVRQEQVAGIADFEGR